MTDTQQNVYVAVSGGVDSAVAAHKLVQQGYHVTAVFMRVWQPDFIPCTQDEDERAALRVAAALGVPFRIANLTQEYKRDVIDAMLASYERGATPNPDVLCNRAIKFGAFRTWAHEQGADLIATGHHAQRRENADGTYALVRGIDPRKDQVYFLWTLTQDDLAHTLLPIGGMAKADVRAYAQQYNLPSATRPDSQGLCFIGHVDMKEFLSHYITTTSGDVLNEVGEVIGTHDGAQLYTLGQRGGFTITQGALQGTVAYVVAKDTAANTITVSREPLPATIATQTLTLERCNWINGTPTNDTAYTCEIRYHGEPIPCRVTTNGDTATLTLDIAVLVARDQSVVVYDGEECLGGGVLVQQ